MNICVEPCRDAFSEYTSLSLSLCADSSIKEVKKFTTPDKKGRARDVLVSKIILTFLLSHVFMKQGEERYEYLKGKVREYLNELSIAVVNRWPMKISIQ